MSAPGAAAAHESPYVGLTPYGEDRADLFFGREGERTLIISNLRAARLTLLYAQSGVGKSSLLHAGVAARLRALARRSRTERGSAGYVPVVFSSWRDEPVEELVGALRDAVEPVASGPIPDLSGMRLSEAIRATAAAADATLLVILDQFEEYFLYSTREARAHRFADELAACIGRPELRANFLIAVREDAYAGLADLFRGKVNNLYGNYLHLEYLDRAAARAAIVRPIEHFNAGRDADRVEVDPDLVEAVLDQVRTGRVAFEHEGRGMLAGGEGNNEYLERIETPYLQLVMSALWERERAAGSCRLRLATLEELGGAERIVHSHLDSAMSHLSDDERDTASEVFNHLVTPSGTKIAHTVSDLAEYSGRDSARVQGLVDRLTAGTQRILRPVPAAPGDEGRPRVEIFHDVLAPAILAWRSTQNAARLEREKQAAEERASADRRRARIFRATAAVSLVLLAAAIVAVILARSETARAVRTQDVALSLKLAGDARSDLQNGVVDQGALLSLEAFRFSDTADARTELVAASAAIQPIGAYLGGHSADVTGVAYSPDGRLIASSDASGRVLVQAAGSGRVVDSLNGADEAVAFSPDGSLLAGAAHDGSIVVWAVPSGRRALVLRRPGQSVYAVAFSPDGGTLAAAGSDHTVVLWNAHSGRTLHVLRGHGGSVNAVAYNGDGTVLASGGDDWTVILWDARTGRRLRTLRGSGGVINGLVFAPDGRMLACAGGDGVVSLWSSRTGRRVASLHGHTDSVNAVAYSPDGATLASAGADRKVILWDAGTGRRITVLRGHSANVDSVAFSPAGGTLVSGGDDEHVIVWDDRPRSLEHELAERSRVLDVSFDPAGTLLAASTLDGSVSLWDPRSGRLMRVLAGRDGPVEQVAFSPSGHELAAANAGGTITVWDPTTGERERTWTADSGPVYTVAFSPDGRTLASGGSDDTVVLWNAATGARQRTLRGHSDYVDAVAFSPDGGMLASGSADDSTILWDVASGRRVRTLGGHTAAVESVAFSPDGRTIASASHDRTVILSDVGSGRQLGAPLSGSGGSVLSVAFSPDGRLLASAGAAGSAILWDLSSRLGLAWVQHSDSIQNLAISPDGRTLSTGSLDRTVQLTGPLPSAVPFDAVRARLCSVVRRSLSRSEWNQFVTGQPYRATCPS